VSLTIFQQKEALEKAFARIGISGKFDVFAANIVKDKKIPKLTQEEIEFVEPFVKTEQQLRWLIYRISVVEKLGEEDPGEFKYDEAWKIN